MADERRHQPAVALRDVAVEERPDMVAANRPGLDQPHVEVGPLRRERKRRQPAGQPTADDGDVAARGRGGGHRAGVAERDSVEKPLSAHSEPVEGASVANMPPRSEEHTSELQSLMRISYAVFCLK